MKGKLNLTTAFRGGKTITEDLFFTSPFKMYSAVEDKKHRAMYINMYSSAGLLKGDENEINLNIKDDSKVVFTDQSSMKIFNSDGGFCTQKVNVRVGENAEFFYVPHPVMTFAHSNFSGRNHIEICEKSTLVFIEIYCCGRTAMGEEFALEKFSSRTEILIDGKTDFIDNTLVSPEIFPEKQKGFFEKYTHTGFLYIYSPKRNLLENLYNNCDLPCTFTEKGFCIRLAGFSAEEISDKFSIMTDNI